MSEIGRGLSHYSITEAREGRGDQGLARRVHQGGRSGGRFLREARLLASSNRPNIAAICGPEESDGTDFLVLELVEGETLAGRIRRGPIPVEEALKLALQAAEALESAHEKGVVDRDPGPADIKASPDRRWTAYTSDGSGEAQAYVRPFPEIDKMRFQVSTSGGNNPLCPPRASLGAAGGNRNSRPVNFYPLPRALRTLSGVAGDSTHLPIALWMAMMTRCVLASEWLIPFAP